MAPKSKTAEKSDVTLAQLLGLKDDASEAAILAAVEALTKATEAKIAELTEQQKLLDTKEEDYSSRLARLVEREGAVSTQEASLKQEADNYKAKLEQSKADIEKGLAEAANENKAALDKRVADLEEREQKLRDKEVELDKRVAELAANPAFAVNDDGNISSVAQDNDATESAPPAKGKIRVTITGPKLGSYRLARQFTSEPVTLDLTKDEFDIVDADPKLQVAEVAK